MKSKQSSPFILWQQVWSLSVLVAAVVFSWTAYSIYQPKILQGLGFVQLAVWLTIIQEIISAIIEPIIGDFSDRFKHRFGSRLPMITTGVTVAGAIFVLTALLLQGRIPPNLRWVVPVLMTFWVIAMLIFRGPVITLLRQTAPLTELPKVNTVITFVFALMGAATPNLAVFFKNIGTSVAFILAAIVLVVSMNLFYSSLPKRTIFYPPQTPLPLVTIGKKAAIFIIGGAAGIQMNLLLRTLPKALSMQNGLGLGLAWITSTILLIAAFLALPIGILVVKIGLKQGMAVGLGLIFVCLLGILFNPSKDVAMVLIFLSGLAFALIFESQIPLALSFISNERAGLSTGIYFGGINAGASLVSIMLQSVVGSLIGITSLFLSAAALLVVVTYLMATRQTAVS